MSDRCAGCGVIRVADDLYRSADAVGVWWHGDCAAARIAALEAELARYECPRGHGLVDPLGAVCYPCIDEDEDALEAEGVSDE